MRLNKTFSLFFSFPKIVIRTEVTYIERLASLFNLFIVIETPNHHEFAEFLQHVEGCVKYVPVYLLLL